MKTIEAPFEIYQEILFENQNVQNKNLEYQMLFHDAFWKQQFQINFNYSVEWIWKSYLQNNISVPMC